MKERSILDIKSDKACNLAQHQEEPLDDVYKRFIKHWNNHHKLHSQGYF